MLSKPNAEKRRTDIPLPTVQNSHIIITATLQNYYEFVTKINIHFKKQNIRAVYFLPMFTLCSNKGLRMHYKRLHPLQLIKKRRSMKKHTPSLIVQVPDCQKSYLAERFTRLALKVLSSKSMRHPCRYSTPSCILSVIL